MAPNSLQQQATQAAEVSLNTNSGVSTATNQLLSLFEGGYDSLNIRNRVDHLLNEYAVTNGFADDMGWSKLRALTGMKEKFAFTIGHDYAKNSGSTTLDQQLLDQTYIKNAVNYVQDHLFAKVDISESFILRHAALNSFEAQYDDTEEQKILGVSQQLLKIAEDNNFTTVAGAMHFHQESDVQKMFKIREAVQMMTKAGIAIDKGILDSINGLSEKIEPLLKLDKSYKHMTQMHSMLNTLGQNVKHSMITPNQKTKLLTVVTDLGKKPGDFIIPLDSRRTVQEYLGELMNQTNRATLDEILKKNVLTRKEFEQWFLSYFAFYNVEESRQQLQDAKSLAFGYRASRYEQDVTFWRGAAKQRILEVAERMTGDNFYGEPAPGGQLLPNGQHGADFQLVNNYFNSFRSLFAADPIKDGQTFRALRKIVSGLVRIRAPLLSRDQRLVETMRRRFKIYSDNEFIAYRDCADSADVIASVILLQGNVAQDMYYEDANKNISPETFGEKISKNVSRAHVGYQAVKKRIGKPLKRLFGFAEDVVRHAGSAVGYTVAATTNILAGSYIDRETKEKKTRGFSFGGYNRWLEKKYSRWKVPAYILYPATRLIEEASKLGNRGSIFAMEGLGKARKMGIEEMKKASGDETVNHLTDGLCKTLDAAGTFVSKSTAAGGQAFVDKLETKQQRRVLGAFYEAASMDKDIAAIMQGADLANMLNLKDYGPYLFDQDGRVQSATTEEKYPETDEGEDELRKDTFNQMYDDIFDQRREHNYMLEDKYNSLNGRIDDMMPSDTGYDETLAQLQEVGLIRDARSKKETDMNSLQNLFNEIAAGREDFAWFQAEVQTIHDRLKIEMEDGEALISHPTTGLKQKIANKEKEIADAKKDISDIDLKLGNTVKKNDKSTTDLKGQKTGLETDIATLRIDVSTLEDNVDTSDRKIRSFEEDAAQHKSNLTDLERSKKEAEKRKDAFIQGKKDIDAVKDEITTIENDIRDLMNIPATIKRLDKEISDAQATNTDVTALTLELEEAKLKQNNIAALRSQKIKDLGAKNKQLGDLERDQRYEAKYTFLGKDPDVIIDDLKSDIADAKQSLITAEEDLAKEKKARLKTKQDVDQKNIDIESKRNEVKAINDKLATRDDADKSRAEYESDKVTLETNIKIFEHEKKNLEKEMKKQDQKNKVHRQAWKFSKNLLSNAERITSLNALPNPGERRAELMKYLKTIKISFYKKSVPAVATATPVAPVPVAPVATP